ncbi:MAG: hypothetical protein K1000chlam2_00871 [Chlamydiae bacterium]|nr:hypothetical protein [Chlamydiota bacterium]
MRGRFLIGSNELVTERNIYADKSSIVLDWLLKVGIEKNSFSLREVAKNCDVSVGLVQRVFEILVLNGFLQTEGVRTAKRFYIQKPHLLLKSWMEHYSIIKKCRMWTYHSGFSERTEILKALEKSKLKSNVAFALHSAAEAHGCKNTNLQTLELYMLEPSIRPKLEEILQLEPQERGYEVLLIKPYYKSLLNQDINLGKPIRTSPILLAYLDLYHFPLRGQEQAEFMAKRIPSLKRIYKATK